ncbi:hypothetical protein ACLOJK_023110 [Asimina triloba]
MAHRSSWSLSTCKDVEDVRAVKVITMLESFMQRAFIEVSAIVLEEGVTRLCRPRKKIIARRKSKKSTNKTSSCSRKIQRGASNAEEATEDLNDEAAAQEGFGSPVAVTNKDGLVGDGAGGDIEVVDVIMVYCPCDNDNKVEITNKVEAAAADSGSSKKELVVEQLVPVGVDVEEEVVDNA